MSIFFKIYFQTSSKDEKVMNIVIHILNSDGREQPLYLSSYDFFDTDIFTEAALQKISKIIFWFI